MASDSNEKKFASLENNSFDRKSRSKASWDAKATKIFIDLCKADVLARNEPGARLRNPVWKLLAPKFNELTKRHFEQHQLKNKWDNLRRDWQLWKMVTDGATDLVWDSTKDTADIDDEWWEGRLKVVPKAAKFQKRAPEHLDDLEVIFSHTVANGEFAWTPSSGKLCDKEYAVSEYNPLLLEDAGGLKAENVAGENDALLLENGCLNAVGTAAVEHLGTGWTTNSNKPSIKEDISKRKSDLQLLASSKDSGKEIHTKCQFLEGNANSTGGDNIGIENLTAETPANAGQNDDLKKHKATENEFISPQKEKKAKTVQGVATLDNEPDRMCEVVESRSSAKSSATSMMNRRTSCSIADVMELMERIPGVVPASQLYMLGTRLFIKHENREMFVALKTEHVRLAWLKQELARERQ